MSEWKAKRFWKSVSIEQVDGRFGIVLDGRPIRTPAKSTIAVPSEPLAKAVAAEWDAVEEKIDPNVMPMTRSVNAAIDKVSVQFAAVADMLAEYGCSDLLCYRAEAPKALQKRQAEHWDPMLDWAAETYGARLVPTNGLMPVSQAPKALAALRDAVHAQTPFQLTALHDLIAISGSLVLGLAVAKERLSASEAFRLSRIDEDWQIEQWGEDEEAQQAAATKRDAFLHAQKLYAMVS